MMIAPKTFYDLNLKDKNEKEIISVIRQLKREMKELKETMENPNYVVTEKPDEATQLECKREYLEEAKKAIEAKGIPYKPTVKEKAALLFEQRIPEIKEIEYRLMISSDNGYLTTVVFENDIANIKRLTALDLNPSIYGQKDKEEILNGLKNLHIGEWNQKYSIDKYGIEATNEFSWDVVITYNDGKKKKFTGDDVYPYNMALFEELIKAD